MSNERTGRCDDCHYCVKYYVEAFVFFWGLFGQPRRCREWCECHRYAPNEDGWPEVAGDDWCGEFLAYDNNEEPEQIAQ